MLPERHRVGTTDAEGRGQPSRGIRLTRSLCVSLAFHSSVLDNVPIRPELRRRFPSNWELSTARAAELVRLPGEGVHLFGDRPERPAVVVGAAGGGRRRYRGSPTRAAEAAEETEDRWTRSRSSDRR